MTQNNDDTEHLLSDQTKESRDKSSHFESYILYINCTYIATIGVSGLVLCAIGSNLNDIAQTVQMDPTELGGNICMFRGLGSITGALTSARVYRTFQGDHVLLCGLLMICMILLLIPSCWETYQLYIFFYILGLCSSINDTGCTILTRKLRGKEAGPWLGANGISFGMSAAIVPIIESLSEDFKTQYYSLSGLIFLVAVSVWYGMQSIYNNSDLDTIMQHKNLDQKEKMNERKKLMILSLIITLNIVFRLWFSALWVDK